MCRDYNNEILKNCSDCKKDKSVNLFPTKKSGKYGVAGYCKDCKAIKDNLYYRKHKGKIQTRYRIWSLTNREVINKHSRNYYYKNKEKHLVLTKNRRARLLKAEGSFTLTEWEALKDKFNHCCALCKKSEPFNQWRKYLTVDHIKPLSKNGTNYISNIQPACFVCNSIKKDKD